jgi:hypothetical protein
MRQSNSLFVLKSVMFGATPIQHITEYHSPYFQAYECYGYSCYGFSCNHEGLGSFSGYKINRMELSTGKILEENLVQSALHQTVGDKNGCLAMINNQFDRV